MQILSPRARKRALTALAAASLSVSMLVPSTGASAEDLAPYAHQVTSLTGDVTIDIQVFPPIGGIPADGAPVLLHSHGWGGSKSSGASSFGAERQAGFGVVSTTQRGHGNSGGAAAVEDPNKEGQDMIAVVDYVAGLDWVAHEEIEDDSVWNNDERNGDPVLGTFGGSYGGGFQYVLAMTEQRDFGGETRVDAMAPDITWNNLNQALAPQDVPRSAWLTALYGAGNATVTMEDYIHTGYAYGAATGLYADGTVPGLDLKGEFATHGPDGYENPDGTQMQLDVPTLLTQGFSDNLFIFNEAWANYTEVLTDDARAKSTLVGYNGGHALPNVAPVGYASGGNKCGGTSTADRVKFFTAAFTGGDTRILGEGEPFHYTTASGECVRLDYDDIDFDATYSPEEIDPSGTLGPAIGSTALAGAPIHLELASGPMTIGGVPTFSGDLYHLGADARVFFGLSVGTSPATAQILQNNVMPFRIANPIPSTGQSVSFDLPGMAERLTAGENLYLTITGTSDMFFGHGSRTPGFIGFTDVEVTIPTVVAE